MRNSFALLLGLNGYDEVRSLLKSQHLRWHQITVRPTEQGHLTGFCPAACLDHLQPDPPPRMVTDPAG